MLFQPLVLVQIALFLDSSAVIYLIQSRFNILPLISDKVFFRNYNELSFYLSKAFGKYLINQSEIQR